MKNQAALATMSVAPLQTCPQALEQGVQPQQIGRLKRELRTAERRKKARALALIAPLALFLLLVFIVPIAILLQRAAASPEVHNALPATLQALADWDRSSLPKASAYAALAQDLGAAKAADGVGNLARRLNNEISGYRSLIAKTARALPLEGEPQAALQALDARWGELAYWQAIAKNGAPYTPFYLLAALDLKQDALGQISPVDADNAIYRDILSRTLWVGAVATLITLLIAFPLAYWASTLSARGANLVMICVLIPFWTSVLVRIAAWIVLLQQNGLVNSALLASGIIESPLALLFNRAGVYISMVHIMLPFMILPLYSVMKSIPSSYQRAAISLGSHPFAAFWRVYIPQTYAGVAAGVLLVFITTIGYYITPALLGGPGDQMVSYYIAYFTNTVVNWGMACALGALLLAATLVLYAIYQRIARPGAAATVR
jgi:putative spermidine/putrescine transport system permease protein